MNQITKLLSLIALTLLIGCGGGSSGTGGSIVKGVLVSDTQEPLAGFTATIKGTTDSSITDTNGNFEINTSNRITDSVEIVFERDDDSVSIIIGDIPEEYEFIDIDCRYDEDEDLIFLDDIDYDFEDDSYFDDDDDLDDEDFDDEFDEEFDEEFEDDDFEDEFGEDLDDEFSDDEFDDSFDDEFEGDIDDEESDDFGDDF